MKFPLDQNPLVYERWLFLADKLERHPDLLGVPLSNIEKWKLSSRLGNKIPLDWWQGLIEGARSSDSGMANLLVVLRDDSDEARQMKSCSPFAGVLTREERDQFTCAWTL